MRITIRLYAILMISIFLLSACDRPASGADEFRLEGLARSTETPLPLPSTTAAATVVVTHEVEVTTIVEVVVTATPEPTLTPDPFASPTLFPSSTEVAMVVDPFVEQGLEFFTEEELNQSQLPGQEQLPFEETPIPPFEEQPFVEQTLDGNYITATYWILETTYEVQTMTATALGPVQEFPTMTATPDGSLFPTTMPEVTWTPTPMTSFGGDCIHEVRAGENLFRLSLRYGVTVNDIARASGVANIQLISIGQRLTIPNCGTTGVFPPPVTGDGGNTGGGNVIPGSVRHVVQQHETLFQISLRYGVTVNDIMAVNPNITNPNLILMTSEIVIPVRQ